MFGFSERKFYKDCEMSLEIAGIYMLCGYNMDKWMGYTSVYAYGTNISFLLEWKLCFGFCLFFEDIYVVVNVI